MRRPGVRSTTRYVPTFSFMSGYPPDVFSPSALPARQGVSFLLVRTWCANEQTEYRSDSQSATVNARSRLSQRPADQSAAEQAPEQRKAARDGGNQRQVRHVEAQVAAPLTQPGLQKREPKLQIQDEREHEMPPPHASPTRPALRTEAPAA